MEIMKEFITAPREEPALRSPTARIQDYAPHEISWSDEKQMTQARRCMNCGTPFCMAGCPLSNRIPDFNRFLRKRRWEQALQTLLITNNFPEFTGHVCPAPCESACVLGTIAAPVTIKSNEAAIINKAFEMGFVMPSPPSFRTGKTVAVIGSGPSGLACAAELNKAGHQVTVFEKASAPGGILTYGIPAYKLPKSIVARRINLMKREGIVFQCHTEIGPQLSFASLKKNFDAIALAIGCEEPRRLAIPGAELKGVQFAMDFLTRQASRLLGESALGHDPEPLDAKGKKVIVIGGGDTGSDCIGTALRQGAETVTCFELAPKPPLTRTTENPWPQYARVYRCSSSTHENQAAGGSTQYSIMAQKFHSNRAEQVSGITTVDVTWNNGAFTVVPDSERDWPCDLVLLALGYEKPRLTRLLTDGGIALTPNGLIAADDNRMTSMEGVFCAGDCRRGQSLVVWAIAEGRDTAAAIDGWLMQDKAVLRRQRLDGYQF
jgi:NAD(P)H-dependent glutamate synthase small subunit